jgi:hypothetical protein
MRILTRLMDFLYDLAAAGLDLRLAIRNGRDTRTYSRALWHPVELWAN